MDMYINGEIFVNAKLSSINTLKDYDTKYTVQGEHSFTDHLDVTGRYELKQSRQATEWGDGYAGCEQGKGDIFSIIAIPLPTLAPVADNPDHIFNPVAELPKEAEGKAKMEWHDKDYWMREYEILRRVMNMRDAVYQIVQMAQSEYEKNMEL